MAQQLSTAVSCATAPHQHALSTRPGCECIAHALQGLTEMDPRATVTWINGVSAFDLISRGAMSGLLQVDGSSVALPFVRMFGGQLSEYLWEDSSGATHNPQCEGVKVQVHQNHFHQRLSSKTIFIKNHFHQKPIKALLVRGTHHPSKNNIVHVCVSPRRFHTNTACAQEGLGFRSLGFRV